MVSRIAQVLAGVACALAATGFAMANSCLAQSGDQVTPVVELYTSEGCSSCPPADRWLSGFKVQAGGDVLPVIEAFHVGYWDYIGWIDRFASPEFTTRQRQIAQWNNQRSIYTPQAVVNGQDWRDWNSAGNRLPMGKERAAMSISLKQIGVDQFEALVSADTKAPLAWSAYWTVTEHGHSSKVKAGENAGELLQHDYVVRQYTPAGDYRSDPGTPKKLSLRSISPTPGHARQINLVVFDSRTGKTLQAVSVGC
jgi:hypothetical protein